MRALCLLQYTQSDSSFVEIARQSSLKKFFFILFFRDYVVNWMTACEIVNTETFLGSENNFNIICAQKDFAAETDEERLRLKVFFKKEGYWLFSRYL